MARLTITYTHSFTQTDLRKLGKQPDNVHLRMHITAVRLVMKRYMGKEVAAFCNLHGQSVATYVKKFNKSDMDALLERKSGPGRPCFLTAEQQNELKQVIVTSSPSNHGLGCASSWITPIIREYVHNNLWG
ncbi:DNA-binding protein [Anoxybacillus geothermalis]|nr:DNA-binding protein [Anoxybacillus geothermalis]